MNMEQDIKFSVIDGVPIKKILEYECHSHWLAPYISFNWGQELIAWYIARKVSRKHKRYLHSIQSRNMINKNQ